MPPGASHAAAPKLERLGAFNFGIQFVWGAVLAVSLQARSIQLTHGTGTGIAAYATIAAVGAAIGAVVQIVAGRFADVRRARVGHRAEFTVAGVALSVPALVWFYLAPDFVQLLTAFALLEVALNIASGPYAAVIPDYVVPERRGVASSFMSAFQSFGNAAGLVLVVFVHDLRTIAAALASGLAASAALTVAHARGLPPLPAERAEPLRLRGPLLALLVSRGTINVGFYTLLGFLLFYVREALGVRPQAAVETQTGLIFLTFTLCAVAGAALAARPTDRYDKRLVISAAAGVMTLGLAGLAIAPGLPFAFAAAGLAGVAWGAFVTADWALAAVLLPPGAMATAMGVWNVATAVPQVIAPVITAPLIVRLDAAAGHGAGARGAIVLALIELAAGAALIWRLPRA